MSMFYELMMRKKEEIMYATIKGTLTENDGVFSGFSDSNYLALQHIIDFSKPFELLFKFTSTDFTNPQYLFSTRYNTTSGFDIYIQNSKIRIWGSTNGTSLDISSYSTDTISVNTTYWYKLKYSPTQIIAELSTDGINFVQENNIALSNQIYQNNYNALIGHGQTVNANYFVGSIELPNSYIKIGATKYNIQAVVGYTVVGSPTITDGVFSGFSSANYLYLPSAPSWSNIDILETFTTFTTSTMNTLQIVMGGRYSQATCCVEITSANKTLFRITYSDSGGTTRYKETTINYVLSANTKYKVKNYFNKQTLVIKSELYDENGIMLASASSSLASDYTSIANINDLWYGYNTQRGTFSGSIDFNNNNTYVKINNKLWFNGQQA